MEPADDTSRPGTGPTHRLTSWSSRSGRLTSVPLVLAIVILGAIAIEIGARSSAGGSDHDIAVAELRGYLEDLAGADLVRYDVHDDRGYGIQPGAIVAAPEGGYAAVYWVVIDDRGLFATELATSPDLVDWTWRVTLAESASQPTIAAASDGGWVVGWEKEPPNHLQVAWYPSWDDLLAARPARFLDVPMTLSPPDCAEGTPSFYSASSTFLDVGFHFFDNCEVDRPARGSTDWVTWTAAPRPEYEAAFRRHGLQGGVGDRDTFTFRGFDFTVQEGQAVWEHFETFRIYLYDDARGVAEPLELRTPAGCVAFSNPMVELLAVDGRPAIVVTAFMLGEAGPECEVGPLLFAQYIDD